MSIHFQVNQMGGGREGNMDVEGDRKGQECLEPFCQFGMEMWYQNKCACILKDVTDSRVLRNKKKKITLFSFMEVCYFTALFVLL